MCAARKHINFLIETFSSERKNAEVTFSVIFKNAEKVANEFDIEFKIPRLAAKQTQRSNYISSSTEEYYRKSLFVPYMDSLISSLTARFPEENEASYAIFILHPMHFKKYTQEKVSEQVNKILNKYEIDNLQTEAVTWYHYWQKKDISEVSEITLLELLSHCDFFPSIKEALTILITIPPITCTIERSFSMLRRVKTWLRSTMGEERLNGLCLISSHRKYVKAAKGAIIEKTINEFAKESRRLKLS